MIWPPTLDLAARPQVAGRQLALGREDHAGHDAADGQPHEEGQRHPRLVEAEDRVGLNTIAMPNPPSATRAGKWIRRPLLRHVAGDRGPARRVAIRLGLRRRGPG